MLLCEVQNESFGIARTLLYHEMPSLGGSKRVVNKGVEIDLTMRLTHNSDWASL